MRDKHSVALIQHYWGKFPNYFPLWLKSAGCNKNFDFIIFTDIDSSIYNLPENVHFIYMTFDEFKARIAKYLDFEFICDTPYKGCDYILMYGLIFQDYLQDYEFWGHADPDVIWGDMSKFITPEMLDKYDRFYRLGHLQFFRNTDKVRTFVLNKLPDCNLSYRDVYQTRDHVAFEETMLATQLFSNFADGGGGQYYKLDFADIQPFYKEFRQFKYYNEVIPAFRWQNGKLFGIGGNGEFSNNYEFLYVHFQKREMKFTPGLENEDSFLIIPNEFVKDHELTQDEIKAFITPDDEYASYINNKYLPRRTLLKRIKLFLSRSTRDKFYRFKFRLNQLLGRELYIRMNDI